MDAASDLIAAVRRQTWAWLFELARRLNVDAFIVDARAALVLSDPDAPVASVLGRPEFDQAVAAALAAKGAESVRTDDSLVTCAALRHDGAAVGALVLVRALPAGTDAAGGPRLEVELVASWIRGSVEAHLFSPPPPAPEEAQRLGALRRALLDAAKGSDAEVVRVFADAVAIWEDVELRAYSEGLNGEYFLQASPAAFDAVPPPPTEHQLAELARAAAQHAGPLRIAAAGDQLTARVESRGAHWLLIFSGALDGRVIVRLSLYVDALEDVLRERAASGMLRLYAGLTRHIFAAAADAVRAEGAVDEIRRALGADHAALTVVLPHGGHALAIGSVDFFTSPARSGGSHLTSARSLPAGGTLACGVARLDAAAPFSRGDRDAVEAVMDLLEPWAESVTRRSEEAQERRTAPRAFEQAIENAAASAVEHGDNVSVLVIRIDEAVFRPGLTQRLAAQIRAHLRAAEPAGALAEGEIGALLFDAGPEQVRAVVARLQRLAPTLDEGASLANAAVGVAWRSGGAAYDTPLVAAARQNALERAAGAGSTRLQ